MSRCSEQYSRFACDKLAEQEALARKHRYKYKTEDDGSVSVYRRKEGKTEHVATLCKASPSIEEKPVLEDAKAPLPCTCCLPTWSGVACRHMIGQLTEVAVSRQFTRV